MRAIEVRLLHESRRFTTFAFVDHGFGRDPMRSEVVRDNKDRGYFCRTCKLSSPCRHTEAVRRFESRQHIRLVAAPSSETET